MADSTQATTSPETHPAHASPRGLLDWLVPLGTAGTLAMNGLANSLRIGGETTGSVSARYPTLITPAGYAFAIWGVIYLALLLFSIYALHPAARARPGWPRLRAFYLASCLLNGLWLVVWHHGLMLASAGVIAALLVSLLGCYRVLDADRRGAPARDRALLLIPFSLYAAWVTVATLINVTVALTALGFRGGGLPPQAWAVALLGVAAGLALIVALPRRDGVWLAVTAWALAAIAVAREAEPLLRGVAAALAGGLALAAIVLWALGLRRGAGTLPAQHLPDARH